MMAMPNYRRALTPGGTWFFTVNLLERRGNDLKLGISAGTRLEVSEENGNILLLVEAQLKTLTALACIGIAGSHGPKLELDELDPARFATKS